MDEVGRVERNIQRELDGRRDRQRDDADDGFELLTLEPVKLKSDT